MIPNGLLYAGKRDVRTNFERLADAFRSSCRLGNEMQSTFRPRMCGEKGPSCVGCFSKISYRRATLAQ